MPKWRCRWRCRNGDIDGDTSTWEEREDRVREKYSCHMGAWHGYLYRTNYDYLSLAYIFHARTFSPARPCKFLDLGGCILLLSILPNPDATDAGGLVDAVSFSVLYPALRLCGFFSFQMQIYMHPSFPSFKSQNLDTRLQPARQMQWECIRSV